MAIKYGGKTTPDYSAMRGPCDKGFHVPMESERQIIKTAIETWWSGNGAGQVMALASYLKIPLGGYRQGSSGDVTGQGTSGRYWTCTGYSSTASRCYKIASSSTSWGNVYQALGCSIRPFKDIPVVPDSNWTVEHQGTGTAGIYSNATLGLISISSDGTNWVTIADKNIGATIVYSYADTFSESNCGKYFQRGNCYGFAWTGSITTSTTLVDTTNYGPGNYYYGSSFVRSSTTWASTDNRNLRGGVTGVQQKPVDLAERYYGGKLVDDYSAMRGPCPEGFHVPYYNDIWGVVNLLKNGFGLTPTQATTLLHIPIVAPYDNSGNIPVASETMFWSNTVNSSLGNVRVIMFSNTSYNYNNRGKGYGLCIRPFSDKIEIPNGAGWTQTYDAGSYSSGAGIRYNSVKGLISISDGTKRYTLSDKNCGATIVYNNGDTLTQTNGGNYYQWGNNHGFPYGGVLTTSSTQVDASNYGPGNYYSSSTFITGNYDWSSVQNNDLRGGVTGVQQKPTKVIEVYYGSTKIWPSYPAGIYWNPNIDGGVISISNNGTDWLTMADKNLGATTVYNYGDTMTEANCGGYYQWGNNYAFPFSGTPSRSSTKVNVSSYGPTNYYSNSTFRRVSGDGCWWTDASATAAANLWGEQTNTNEARRGPCSEGFHIPSHNEIIAWRNMTGLEYEDRLKACKIPMMGTRDNYTAGVVDRGTDGGMRTTTLYDSDSAQGGYYSSYGVCRGLPIRPFRNEAIMPDDTRIPILN